MTARFGRVPDVLTDKRFNGKVQVNMHLLEKAAKRKKPEIYAIWNDLYHPGVTLKQVADAHCIMDRGINLNGHTFLIVTKRPEAAAAFCEGVSSEAGVSVPDNIWHIVTCENQAMADKRIPHLLRIPGKRGIIIEPMLEEINIKPRHMMRLEGGRVTGDIIENPTEIPLIHQVICGPENGTGKRPFDPAWADSVKAQCEGAGVPFYRKDTGKGVLAWRQ